MDPSNLDFFYFGFENLILLCMVYRLVGNFISFVNLATMKYLRLELQAYNGSLMTIIYAATWFWSSKVYQASNYVRHTAFVTYAYQPVFNSSDIVIRGIEKNWMNCVIAIELYRRLQKWSNNYKLTLIPILNKTFLFSFARNLLYAFIWFMIWLMSTNLFQIKRCYWIFR